MKNNYSLKFKKFDIFVIAFAAVLIVLSIIFTNIIFGAKTNKRIVQIYYQNKLLENYQYDLNDIKDEIEITLKKDDYDKLLGDIIIKINKDKGVAIHKATCPNHYCTNQGYVKNVGYPVVCVPNGVYVVISSNTIDEEITLG